MSTSIVTDDGLAKIIGELAGTLGNLDLATFKFGEGGWEDLGGGPVPKTPDPTLSDLDVLENPGSYPLTAFSYSKALVAADLTLVNPNELEVRCFIGTVEANDDGTGASPVFYELGIFDSAGVMIAYETFAGQTKDDTRALNHKVTLKLTRA